ncbi:hypothetical protein Dimus_031259 [Dionaea muscipula]
MSMKPTHDRKKNYSGELDVFEAARYYARIDDEVAYPNLNTSPYKKLAKEEHRLQERRGSLDITSLMRQSWYHEPTQVIPKQKMKKHEQPMPSSPGGRLAHFLNSLFSQTIPKKKKSSSSSSSKSPAMESEDDHETSPPAGWKKKRRRRRRRSISNFWSTTITRPDILSSKSLYSSSNSGMRPPPPPPPPRKDIDILFSISKSSGTTDERRDQKTKYTSNSTNEGILETASEEEGCKLGDSSDQVDYGWDSDLSSDLFELQLDCRFGFCNSKDLPVYESTNVDCITRQAGAGMITNQPVSPLRSIRLVKV